MTFPLLSLFIGFPLLAALLIMVLPVSEKVLKWINLLFNIVLIVPAGIMLNYYLSQKDTLQSYGDVLLTEKWEWFNFSAGKFGRISVDYFLGVDGLNFALILLSVIIFIVAAVFAFEINEKVKAYLVVFQIMTAAVFGSFLALDFFLFYIFFEFMLLPMFFLIGIWGGPKREYASLKFFLYTLLGSLFILAVMIALNISSIDSLKSAEMGSDIHGFDLFNLMAIQNYLPDAVLGLNSGIELFGIGIRHWAFWVLMIGFLIKLPAVPFHTWLPNAHVEAPTPVSVVLAALLLKIGAYGIFRVVIPLFPEVFSDSLIFLGLIGVVSMLYGGFNAIAMRDLKKMIAYSSVAHMGFVLLGLASFNAQGFQGAYYQILSHGLLSAALFIIAGVVYHRTGSRNIDDFSGLNQQMPAYGAMTLLVFLAALGLPGFSGFISEVLVLIGTFEAIIGHELPVYLAIAAIISIFLSATYFLWAMQRMFFGTFTIKFSAWRPLLVDLKGYEKWTLIALVALSFILGIFPFLILENTEGTIAQLLQHIGQF